MRRVARVAVLGVMASGLLSLTAIVRAAPAVSPTLSPPQGQGAVKTGDTVTFGGITEPGATLVGAELLFFDAAGKPALVFEQDDETFTNSLDVRGFIRLEGGGITGQFTLPSPCLKAATARECRDRLNGGTIKLSVTVERNGEASGTSDGVLIDLDDPYIKEISLVEPNRVKIQFSEDVALPPGTSESPLDWTIGDACQRGRPVTEISPGVSSGSVRYLTLLLPEDEDATQTRVTYCPLPNRPFYHDPARRNLTGSMSLLALDRIAPKIPAITAMAGRTGDDVTANDPSPVVRVSGLRAGHFGQVYLETGSEPGFQLSQDTLLGEAQANGSGIADVQVLRDFGADGTYELYGVARDRATCTSRGTEVCPNYSGGDRALYTLDTVVPLPLFAATEGPEVIVRFNEEVSGTDDPSQWSVARPGEVSGTPPTSVSGGGEERILSVTPDAPAGSQVAWTAPPAGGYADEAGNQVASFGLEALDHIPPVIDITDPLTTVWTTADSYPVTGSVSKAGSTIQAFDGEREVARKTLGPDQTQFTLGVPLNADTTHNFTLRATDGLGNVNVQDTFLSSIIQDSSAPTVSVVAPTKDDILQGGGAFTIKWQASDANFGSGPIRIEWSADGGDWQLVKAGQGNTGEYSWQVPSLSTEQAQIRIRAEDQVGFATEALSELFSIDFDRPTFAAVSLDDPLTCTQSGRPCVLVHFSEAMEGHVEEDEWKIDGIPAGSATGVAMGVGTKVKRIILETLPTQELGKNAAPEISYEPGTVPGRTELHDEAGNTVPDHAKTVRAEDGIAPLVPVIAEINGQSADGTVTSNDATPEVRVTNLDRGDTAQIFVESDGTPGFSPGDRLVGSARTGPSGATQNELANTSEAVVTTQPLGGDGDYTLYAAAMDPAGNVSEGADTALYRIEAVVVISLPTPVIEEIAGKPATEAVTANDSSPEVKVGSIDEGHIAAVYKESDGQAGFTAGDAQVGQQTAGSDGAVVQTADLGADATYTLYAIARDDQGNRSAAADQATYILDTTNPLFTAGVVDERHVLVKFGEAVAGLAAEAEWQIDGIPSNTTAPAGMASGVTTLQLEALPGQTIAPTATPQITYSPVGSPAANPAPAEFVDAAGNNIAVKSVRAVAQGQPIPVPPGGQPPQPPTQQPPGGGERVPAPGGGTCDVLGTTGKDILLGTGGADVICGGPGADVIRAGAGKDVIFGQAGKDVLRGGSGNDKLRGGADKDSLFGEAGRDTLRGEGGVDRLSGGPGKDLLDGGPSKDRCTGGPGANRKRRC
ncbi:MAG TPA: calcium-binding protein [Actinomycetota bacterium]|nr:calcium-binding protein [Actinomycetota bacterium]